MLLGCILESRVDGRPTAGRIVEAEAYVGPHDAAAHGYRNRFTTRNAHLFGPPGSAYVYFVYGMHWCFNAVTEREDYPAAVLVRALEPVAGIEVMRERRELADVRRLCAGPARLCQALGITGAVSGTSLVDGPVRILSDRPGRRHPVQTGPRVGITKAAQWPLRFWVEGSEFVSR
jgi:DNA-3-methyladenine glycosylase